VLQLVLQQPPQPAPHLPRQLVPAAAELLLLRHWQPWPCLCPWPLPSLLLAALLLQEEQEQTAPAAHLQLPAALGTTAAAAPALQLAAA
jgi:hypothetical protein